MLYSGSARLWSSAKRLRRIFRSEECKLATLNTEYSAKGIGADRYRAKLGRYQVQVAWQGLDVWRSCEVWGELTSQFHTTSFGSSFVHTHYRLHDGGYFFCTYHSQFPPQILLLYHSWCCTPRIIERSLARRLRVWASAHSRKRNGISCMNCSPLSRGRFLLSLAELSAAC